VTVQVSEIEPARAGGRERSDSGRGRSDSSLSSGGRALPATYQARGGQQDLNGDVSFPTGATCRFVQTTLGSGWRLRFEVQDEGLSMRALASLKCVPIPMCGITPPSVSEGTRPRNESPLLACRS
ncbi:unnamed protein product, partial [Prorocentrum cordatum]